MDSELNISGSIDVGGDAGWGIKGGWAEADGPFEFAVVKILGKAGTGEVFKSTFWKKIKKIKTKVNFIIFIISIK